MSHVRKLCDECRVVIRKFISFSGKDGECCSTHLIDGDGTFNASGLENFMKEVKLSDCGLSYAVVSIMGPQSSGMSHFFLQADTCCLQQYLLLKGKSFRNLGVYS